MTEGKEKFYKKAEEALKSSGFQYYGEKDIAGIGKTHSSKSDYIAGKDGLVIISEIKPPSQKKQNQRCGGKSRGTTVKNLRLSDSMWQGEKRLENCPERW